MNSILPIVAGALRADVSSLDTIGQNVANLETPGYRAQQALAGFGRALHAHGVALSLANGPLLQTSGNLDLALQGPGFFMVEANGQVMLERDGQFGRDAQGRLVDGHGYPVLTDAGALTLPDRPVRIAANGTVFDGTDALGRLRIVDVAQPAALEPVGGNLFAYRGAFTAAAASVHQGALEGSNVDAAGAMVQLIALSRHAESVQHALAAYDQAMDAGVKEIGTGS